MKKNGSSGRRASWRASSQRYSRSSAKGKNAVGMNDVAVSQYEKQLNPYKLSSSLRGSHTDSLARGVSDDVDMLSTDKVDLGLGIGDDDNDDLGLDNILSSIVDSNDRRGLVNTPSPVNIENDLVGKDIDDVPHFQIKSHRTEEPVDSSCVVGNLVNEHGKAPEKDMSNQRGSDNMPPLMQADFGNESSHLEEQLPNQSTTKIDDDIGCAVSEVEGGNCSLWSDDAATKKHKMMVQRCHQPAFSSGGFENARKLESTHMTGPSFQTGAQSGVDSIIDEIVMSNHSVVSGKEEEEEEEEKLHVPLTNDTTDALTSSRLGQLTNRHAQDPAGIKCATQSTASSKISCNPNLSLPSKVAGDPEEDVTLSTFTEPSDSPVIYTYKKSRDDDSVSQITSSLAGSSGAGGNFGASLLQNIPPSFGSRSSNFSRINGPFWMDNSTGVDGVTNRNRMSNRKGGMVIPGAYGRNRCRRSSKFSTNTSGGGGQNTRGSYNTDRGSKEITSFDIGQSSLDEKCYALNADAGRNGRSQKKRYPPPVRRNTVPFRGNSMELDEELSTVESSRDGEYVETNAKSNVSRLGMSGVSCGQSVSETTVVSDLSKTLGLFQSLSMFAWKAQHHLGRFIFPTSSAVKQRKKFDKSDSMDDLEKILLEEGANTLPHRKQGGVCLREDDGEEEIDYFSLAMSVSKPKKSKQKEKFMWRHGALFLVLTFVLTLCRIPRKINNPVALSNERESIDGVEKGLIYDVLQIKKERDKVSDKAHLVEHADMGALDRSDQKRDRHSMQLSPVFDALANVDDLLFQQGVDVPFFWHVPRSGGGTMNDVLGRQVHAL